MTAGIQGTGFYGNIRMLINAIKNDQHQLDCAPLGPIQKKRLQVTIEIQKAELKKVRAEFRASKNKI